MTLTPLRTEIRSGWTLRAASGPAPAEVVAATIPATVPGCAHTDLLAAGLIPDPYLDDNEALTAWIGLVDWTYATTFCWQANGRDRHDLVFEGLDTVATVTLNGVVILEAANQHRSYRVDVRAHLREGENTLEVAFRSPVRYANERSMEYGARPRPYPLPYEAIRKSAASFGWDWGIATFTSGIWRPVRLESWSVARIAEVRVHAAPAAVGGRADVDVVVQRDATASGIPLEVTLDVAGATATATVPAGADRVRIGADAPDAELWWPVGYGEQPLYDLTVVVAADGHESDAARRRVGFRSVRWDTEPDADGTPFTLIVNDQPVYVKGVNWIPDDALTVRVDRARYERRLRQARDAHLNLVRVWGGGIYESEDFYDVCDELGLLSWQDFLFACAAYPEEEPLRSEIEAEAREQIVRLSSHASLVLLTGNNENVWGYEDWGWKQHLDGKTWGAYYYHELFPELVAELAPHVPYTHGSPFSPHGQHPNDEAHGTMHLWEQWNRQDYPTYLDHRPRFVAEFGWQGPPTWSTLTRSISDTPLTPESPGMIVHQKAAEGNDKLTRGLLPHYRMPADMSGWHWAMQLNQAEAVRFALEHFRALAPLNSGAIVWQLNDCWPVTSWAAIDGDERLKPLWYALKNAFAPRVVSVQPRDGGLSAVIGNDTAEEWSGDLVVRRVGFDGRVLAEQHAPFTVAARGSLVVPVESVVATAQDAASELLVASAGDVRGVRFFAEPRDSALAAARYSIVTAPAGGGTEVRVTAHGLIKDLALLVDRAHPDAVVLDGLVTLLPGESATFVVRHPSGVDVTAFAAAEVVRTANELVGGAGVRVDADAPQPAAAELVAR
ncbi:glycoside hydrolase family 2 protein [Microbacterium sp.]|uniref:glycoside hydrolase family 2 protein n=1 Tax=Microbacterium sp. TaxID=51671 RepID=UPI0028123F9C|nr:glycoside hydrolase family 2 protein [Microbacterium sp.]